MYLLVGKFGQRRQKFLASLFFLHFSRYSALGFQIAPLLAVATAALLPICLKLSFLQFSLVTEVGPIAAEALAADLHKY